MYSPSSILSICPPCADVLPAKNKSPATDAKPGRLQLLRASMLEMPVN
jgi:hypothetical protein